MVRYNADFMNHPDWSKNLSVYEVNLRQFTPSGTFREFESHLPRLKELGVGILWFMPIHPIGVKNRKGSLGSQYSVRDYTAVNPEYGTLDEFKSLVKKIHDSGMYVIIDWVANHTAWDHVWTESNQDFYSLNGEGNLHSPFAEWSDVIHLNYDNPALWEAMIHAMKFWITETDIDGFRCDMAHLVRTPFWEKARKELDLLKPVFMLAESENRELLHSAFDTIYNWNLLHWMDAMAKGWKGVPDLDAMLQHEVFEFPAQSFQLLFTDNHDENSWNGSAIERLGYSLEPCDLLTFTLHGMPLIYSGQEAGDWRRLSFFDKDLIQWKDDKLIPFYQKLNALKKRNEALWNGLYGGNFRRIRTSADRWVFSFVRQKNEYQVLVLINFSGFTQQVRFEEEVQPGNYYHVFEDRKIELGTMPTFQLDPWKYLVFEQ